MGLPLKVIERQLQEIFRDPTPGIFVAQDEFDAYLIHAYVEGPNETPFEGGKFLLELFCPIDFPLRPPKIRFVTKVYHPNIDKHGRFCQTKMFKLEWSPALHIIKLLVWVQALLSDPNLDDPVENNVATLWKENEETAIQIARKWTRTYAMGS